MRSIGIVVLAVSSVLSQAEAPLDAVVAAATRYVAAYERDLGTILADEKYFQEATWHRSGSGNQRLTRTLSAEFAMLKVPGEEWLAVRRVANVDGNPMSDQQGSIKELLGDESRPLASRLNDLIAASAEYNLGDIRRTINLPTFALLVLREVNVRRFEFTKERESHANGVNAWVVRFVERQKPTLVRSDGDRDVFSEGSFWLDPENGRVLRTVLSTHDTRKNLHANIEVDYEPEARLGIWVPTAMRETYQHGRRHTVRANARYSNYRRFDVRIRVVGPNGGDGGNGIEQRNRVESVSS